MECPKHSCGACGADEEYLNIPNMSLDFDLDSEQLDLTPTATRASSLGYGIASLAAEEIDEGHSGQGIALVVDAEVGVLFPSSSACTSIVRQRARGPSKPK